MTITISAESWQDIHLEALAQAQYPDPEDAQDYMFQYPPALCQGYVREITLRDGLELRFDNYTMGDDWYSILPERSEWLCFHFHLLGGHRDTYTEVGNLEYALYGCGLAPAEVFMGFNRDPVLELQIAVSPEVFRSFLGKNGELPWEYQHLVRSLDQTFAARIGVVSATMQRILWQMIRCPYLGITKRLYLESKALEMMVLILEEEGQIQREKYANNSQFNKNFPKLVNLKPDDLARVYQAKEILLQHLEQPPELMDLAQQVGLNTRSLKEGFRQIFGQPPFAYLRDYRLEQARKLLATGDLNVVEVAQRVGFADRGNFARQFRVKFGVNPKQYQLQNRKL